MKKNLYKFSYSFTQNTGIENVTNEYEDFVVAECEEVAINIFKTEYPNVDIKTVNIEFAGWVLV